MNHKKSDHICNSNFMTSFQFWLFKFRNWFSFLKKKKKVLEFYTTIKAKRSKALLKLKSERPIESKSNSN